MGYEARVQIHLRPRDRAPLARSLCRASFFTRGVDLTNYRTNARRHLRLARSNAVRPLALTLELRPFV